MALSHFIHAVQEIYILDDCHIRVYITNINIIEA